MDFIVHQPHSVIANHYHFFMGCIHSQLVSFCKT